MDGRGSLVVAAVSLVAILPGCSSVTGPAAEELEENLRTWRARGISSYTYAYRLNCFCGGPGIRPVEIEVRDGAVAAVRVLETGEPEEFFDPEAFPTVEDLFQTIREALDRDPFRIRAEYDDLLGYPRDVFIDFEQNVIDEEFGFVTSDLEPL